MFETKDIMVKDVITVKEDTSIYDAIQLMIDNNITGLPVVNDDGYLKGILSEEDALDLLTEDEDHTGKVKDYMTTDIVTFDQNEDYIAICECLINNHFRRVPILAEGKVAGIISRKDIIKFITEPIE